MRVIKHLHKDGTSGFTRNDGWNLKTWERNFEGEKVSHKVDYLIHTNGHVITSQYKAYNDYVRMAMMIGLIFKHVATVNGGKLVMWCDNCSIHNVEKLKPIWEAANVVPAFLPPNLTHLLQVMDLVVNGPIKAHIRSLRSDRLMNYFNRYNITFTAELNKPKEQSKIPKWDPPKPTETFVSLFKP